MGFFSYVQYDSSIQDTSWYSQAEEWANVCRAPRRWLAAELFNRDTRYQVEVIQGDSDVDFEITPHDNPATKGAKKIIRIVLGFFLAIPGELAAIPLMGFAFINKEIRICHHYADHILTDAQKAEIKQMIETRQRLNNERQGEPVTCLLYSICCLLCCLVCSR